MTTTGRCLCGSVRYELADAPGPCVNCHCQFCRRAHGAAFVTVTWVPRAGLRVTQGAESVREFRTQGVGLRAFCRHCGTRLYNQAESNPDFVALVVGSLDDEPDGPPVIHVNVESKARWYEIQDDRPQFDKLPPGTEEALRPGSE